MARIDPTIVPVVSDAVRGLRQLGIEFGVVGALVPELLIEERPRKMTNDADITVVLQSLDEFNALKLGLAKFGFDETRLPYRLRHREGGLLDLLPYSEAIAPGGRLELRDDIVFNMAGFGQVVPNSLLVEIEGGPTLPLAPLPLYALLKLTAFSDRQKPKDLAGVLHCLRNYAEDDERKYGLDHDGEAVPFEFTSAYLLGQDGRRFHEPLLSEAVRGVLDRFDSADADVVDVVAREEGRRFPEERDLVDIFELFRWFRSGTGI